MRVIKKAKPCPFCGDKGISYFEGEGWFIYCRGCNAQIGDSRSKAKLLERWNRRAANQPLDQKIYVDQDGVLCDFVGGICKAHNLPNPIHNPGYQTKETG